MLSQTLTSMLRILARLASSSLTKSNQKDCSVKLLKPSLVAFLLAVKIIRLLVLVFCSAKSRRLRLLKMILMVPKFSIHYSKAFKKRKKIILKRKITKSMTKIAMNYLLANL